MKKILLSFCCIILIFSNVSFADDDDLEEITWQEIDEIRQVSGEITDEPVISSRYGIVIERSSRKNFVCEK